jgi:hypothetical protein
MQLPSLLLSPLNDATAFIVVVVGSCRQDGGGGEEVTTPADAPAATHGGGGDTPEIEEFCRRRPGCNVYIDRAAHHGSTNVQGRRQDGSLVDYDDDDDSGDNNDDNWGPRGDAQRGWGRVRVPP